MGAIETGLVMVISFIILMAMGVPISVATGIASFIAAIMIVPFDVAIFTAAQKMVTGIDSFSLLAVIFFILSGIIMNNGGIALRLVNLAKLLGGSLPGSLAHTNVVGNMLFGSISGSAVAAAAAIGGTMAPLQEKEGYNKAYSAAVNIASSPAGLLIPPSGAFIIYSMVSGGTSIAALFLAGYVPGILMGLTVMAIAYYIAKKENYPVAKRPSFSEGAKVIIDAIPSLLLIVIVIGGIVAGVFTATEGSAVAVLYSVILSIIYKTLKWSDVPKILGETVVMTGIVLFLVAASSIMSWVMAFSGIPAAISEAVLSISDNPIVILLIMNVVLLLVGTVMDITPAILIFTPIFLPIVTQIGMDPVHFGIVLVFNLCIGIVSPPSGSSLFVGCSVGGVSIEAVTKPLLIFMAGLIVTLLLVTYIPAITLFVPKLFGAM
ncbi:TRAP transporter large permease [Neobacillus sp. 179-C4.2 HS]|jgi:tripartite ATP-independent transporter DctM subunit|uniref:TRAP transporter large permease n=1 Tax=Neobacillus driksii TaxID=3035913 RepID=A0ABV4YPM9_9BACI|nr:TRAP transporter large permease [Neobacillus sp. 179.-C4.2 HS]MDP5195552.1 TRAP transporter large permease [Neobacillus sp. 179.-C4.2 HS]